MKPDKEEGASKTLRLSTATAERMERAETPTSRALLLVYHRDGVEAAPLSPSVSVVVGREPPSDVVINDRNLSRRQIGAVLEALPPELVEVRQEATGGRPRTIYVLHEETKKGALL